MTPKETGLVQRPIKRMCVRFFLHSCILFHLKTVFIFTGEMVPGLLVYTVFYSEVVEII